MNSSTSKSNNSSKNIYLFVILLLGILLIAASTIGVLKYRDSQANKIYSVGEAMRYSGFKVTVTKSLLKPVDLPLDNDVIAKYGGLGTQEDCSTFSDQSTSSNTISGAGLYKYALPNPSPRVLCVRRNNSRNDLNSYMSKYKQLNIDYKIQASATVITKNIKIQLLPASGVDLTKSVDSLNGNEFMYDNLVGDTMGINNSTVYTPYKSSPLGGNVNNGLSRSGYIYTDVSNTESSVDFSLTYKNAGKTTTKITRVNLAQ